MVVVGFDTATADTAACAWRDGEVLHESQLGVSAEGSPQHTAALLREAERCASAVGGWARVDRLAVGLGPGSFTGLRIGIATARGLGTSLGTPVGGVCTLDALARGLAETGEDGECLTVLDARRGEVFAALYGEGGQRIWEPFVCLPEELEERLAALPSEPLTAGSGAIRFRQELARHGARIADDADPVHRVAARHTCVLAAISEAGGPLAPIYLRPPDAERWRERNPFQRPK